MVCGNIDPRSTISSLAGTPWLILWGFFLKCHHIFSVFSWDPKWQMAAWPHFHKAASLHAVIYYFFHCFYFFAARLESLMWDRTRVNRQTQSDNRPQGPATAETEITVYSGTTTVNNSNTFDPFSQNFAKWAAIWNSRRAEKSKIVSVALRPPAGQAVSGGATECYKTCQRSRSSFQWPTTGGNNLSGNMEKACCF